LSKERIFILDYDLISPLGFGNKKVFSSLRNNYLAGARIKRFPVDGMKLNVAAEVNVDLSPYYQAEDQRIIDALYYDRKLELIVSCYHQMKDRLEYFFGRVTPERAGVSLGVGSDVIPFELVDPILNKYSDNPSMAYGNTIDILNKNGGKINRVLNPSDFAAIFLANRLNLAAFQKVVLTACTASTQAIALAFDSIRMGEADMVLTGGTDSIIDMISYTAFSKLGVISPCDRPDNKTCRPFDISRNGTLAGESASLIILASGKTVQKLGIDPKLEMLGYGNTLDGYKITAPDPNSLGMKRAMKNALKSAHIAPEQVDYINLHGTGTLANDPLELNAIKDVFGSYAAQIPASSTKDRHGHAIASAGGQEFIITCLCMENDFVPCTLNLEKPINQKEVNLVQDKNIIKRITIGLTNNFAFGGVNTVLAVKRCH
jgi:3-oxoacyl-[acyl-carrier-protein] synthase II